MKDRIAKFEKVTFEQFMKDRYELFNLAEVAKAANFSEKEMEMVQKIIWNDIKLPVRSTKGSAGYDFCSTINVELRPRESIVVPTGIKCRIDDGWFLMIVPRSGLGFKYNMTLANTAGIIDSDYYNCEKNEGHIMVKIVNKGDKEINIKEGEKFAQGIFIPYGITDDDSAEGERIGGFGSTGVN